MPSEKVKVRYLCGEPASGMQTVARSMPSSFKGNVIIVTGKAECKAREPVRCMQINRAIRHGKGNHSFAIIW